MNNLSPVTFILSADCLLWQCFMLMFCPSSNILTWTQNLCPFRVFIHRVAPITTFVKFVSLGRDTRNVHLFASLHRLVMFSLFIEHLYCVWCERTIVAMWIMTRQEQGAGVVCRSKSLTLILTPTSGHFDGSCGQIKPHLYHRGVRWRVRFQGDFLSVWFVGNWKALFFLCVQWDVTRAGGLRVS